MQNTEGTNVSSTRIRFAFAMSSWMTDFTGEWSGRNKKRESRQELVKRVAPVQMQDLKGKRGFGEGKRRESAKILAIAFPYTIRTTWGLQDGLEHLSSSILPFCKRILAISPFCLPSENLKTCRHGGVIRPYCSKQRRTSLLERGSNTAVLESMDITGL